MEELQFLRAVAALLFVVGLLLGLAWAFRRLSPAAPGRGPLADVSVVGWRALDARRRLAVVRWGTTEHLLLLGPEADVVVQSRSVSADALSVEVTP
jgi:flagellar biogenesis protein FliO